MRKGGVPLLGCPENPTIFSASPQAVGGRCHQNAEGIPRWHQISLDKLGGFMKLAPFI